MQAIWVRHCADQHAFQFVSILDSGEVVTFCGYGKFSVPPPTLLTLAVPRLFQFLQYLLFILLGCLSFHQLPGICFSSSLFPRTLLQKSCLLYAQMPDWCRAFVHGHTFLHSWNEQMTLVVGLLHVATFLSYLPLVLYTSFTGYQQLERTPIKPYFYYFYSILDSYLGICVKIFIEDAFLEIL